MLTQDRKKTFQLTLLQGVHKHEDTVQSSQYEAVATLTSAQSAPEPLILASWDADFTAPKLSLPGYSDAFRVDILGGNGLLQFVQLSSLLQLLHQTFDRLFAPFLLLAVLLSLLPAQKSFDDGGSERQN